MTNYVFLFLASNATDSTLYASSTQHHQKQTGRCLSSQKSNISTLTRDDIDLNLPAEEQMSSIEVNNNNTASKDSFVTTVEIEHEPKTNLPQFKVTGVDNRAYDNNDDDVDQSKLAKRHMSVPKSNDIGSEAQESTANPNVKPNQGQVNLNFEPLQQQNNSMSRSSSSASSYYEGYSEDDLSDVSTTIIDGKRAISLSNFGKYAAHQQKRYSGAMTGPIYGYQLASAGFRAHKPVASK